MQKLSSNKAGKGTTTMFAMMTVVVIAALGGFIYFAGSTSQSTIGGTGSEGVTDASLSTFCSNNAQVDLNARVRDTGVTSSLTYKNATLLVKNLETGSLTTQSIDNVITATTSNFDTISNAFVCGNAFDVVVRSTQDDVNGGFKVAFASGDTQRDPVEFDGESTYVSNLRMRVWDIDDAKYLFDTSGVQTHVNAAAIFNTTTDGDNDGKTINADDTYNFRIDTKTVTADRFFGQRTWIAFNTGDGSNIDDWQEPDVATGGVSLTEISTELDGNDVKALTDYEYIYDLGKAIDEKDTQITVGITTGSSVNADFDIVWRFVGTGTYTDESQANGLIGDSEDSSTNPHGIGFRNDGSTRSEIITSTAQTGTLLIA